MVIGLFIDFMIHWLMADGARFHEKVRRSKKALGLRISLDSILSIGRRIRSREVMEKEQNKEEGYVKGLERRKRKDEILRKIQVSFFNLLIFF